jgi:haloacetate dehalogenase
MNATSDLFPGFGRRMIEGDGATIHCRIAGSGPPVLLLHGFPQTHAMWHKVAPVLAEDFTVVVADLRGYGESSVPARDGGHLAYAKRTMARDCVAVMRRLGHDRFSLVGHDRGARVAYRMAFDTPEALERIAVLDILPTWNYWQRLDRTYGNRIYHWMFLAQPHPFPETMIGAAPDYFVDHSLASWTATKTLAAFDPVALELYRAQMRDKDRRVALCEDYRAGAGPDYEHDDADHRAGRRIGVALLALWGSAGIARGAESPADVWGHWANNVSGEPIDCGHFLPEEAPEATVAALRPFLRAK